jgi:hypothetical protein
MKLQEAISIIENTTEYWVEEAEYEKKEEDIKKLNKALNLIKSKFKDNDKIMGIYCESRLVDVILDLEDAFTYIENICGSDYEIIYKKRNEKFDEDIND